MWLVDFHLYACLLGWGYKSRRVWGGFIDCLEDNAANCAHTFSATCHTEPWISIDADVSHTDLLVNASSADLKSCSVCRLYGYFFINV